MNKNRPIKRQIDAAAFADVTTRTVRRWTKMGMPRTPEGFYYPVQLLAWKKARGRKPLAQQQCITEQIQSIVKDLGAIQARLSHLFD